MKTEEQNHVQIRLSRVQRFAKKRSEQKLAQGLLVVCWTLLLLILTSSSNFNGLFHFNLPLFKWNPSPDFMDLFNFHDFNIIHKHYFIVKLGHFVGFAFMEYLIYRFCGSKGWAIVITVLFAISTEILQLFTFRDGRIYDMLIDSAGAWLSYRYGCKRNAFNVKTHFSK
jgi:hypothetical protein